MAGQTAQRQEQALAGLGVGLWRLLPRLFLRRRSRRGTLLRPRRKEPVGDGFRLRFRQAQRRHPSRRSFVRRGRDVLAGDQPADQPAARQISSQAIQRRRRPRRLLLAVTAAATQHTGEQLAALVIAADCLLTWMKQGARRHRLQSKVGTGPEKHQSGVLLRPPEGQLQRVIIGAEPHRGRCQPILSHILARHDRLSGDFQLHLSGSEQEEVVLAARGDKQMSLPACPELACDQARIGRRLAPVEGRLGIEPDHRMALAIAEVRQQSRQERLVIVRPFGGERRRSDHQHGQHDEPSEDTQQSRHSGRPSAETRAPLLMYHFGQCKCWCRKSNVPLPWIAWPSLENSMAVRSPRPRWS